MANDSLEKGHSRQIETMHDNNGNLSKVPTIIEGTTQLYEDGKLNYIPMPSADPKDPLNLPTWRKIMCLVSLCFYGAISLSTQQIVAALLPVFVFVYAGLDPNLLTNRGGIGAAPTGTGGSGAGGFPGTTGAPGNFTTRQNPYGGSSSGAPNSMGGGVNSLSDLAGLLAMTPGAPTLTQVNLLSSLPVLIVGLSNYVLVPMSIAIGRRPVICLCGLLAWTCTLWAGKSQSLWSHLGARCLQAVGSGAVESLIPFIAQDISFIHQRSRAIGIIWASQGIVTLALGIGSSYIVTNLGWRWLYFILSILTASAWLMCLIFVPETRWQRTSAEMRGVSNHLPPGERRPAIDTERYGPRNFTSNFGFMVGGLRPKDAGMSFLEIIETLLFPNVIWIVFLNAIFIGVSLASSQTMSTVLLAPPYSWSFKYIGFSSVSVVIATIFVYLIGSYGADKIANWLTLRRGGIREPEVHLYNMILPLFCGIFGCILFGVGGEYVYKVHWMAILSGTAILNFAFLTVNIIGSVYCVESYPKWAGSVLVNVASFRNIIGFGFTYGVTNWVQARGYMGCFGIYAGCIAFMCIPLPIMWKYGKQFRKRAGFLTKKTSHSL